MGSIFLFNHIKFHIEKTTRSMNTMTTKIPKKGRKEREIDE